MLEQFAVLLNSLAGPTVTFINGQGTLAPQPSSWHNEFTPHARDLESSPTFSTVRLKALFPGRVA